MELSQRVDELEAEIKRLQLIKLQEGDAFLETLGGSSFSYIKTTNGTSNNVNYPKGPYPTGDVPDGWQYIGTIKTDQENGGKPVFVPAYTWSGGLEPAT